MTIHGEHRTLGKRNRKTTAALGLAAVTATGVGLAGGAGAATTSSSAAATLAKIKYCESGGNYQAVNSSSGASGAYQFLPSTWKGLAASAGYATAASAPASVQDAAALELYEEAGTSPWASSSSCWSGMTSTPTGTSTAASTNAATRSQTTVTNTAAQRTQSPSRDAHSTSKPVPKAVGSVKCDKGRPQPTPHPVKPTHQPLPRPGGVA